MAIFYNPRIVTDGLVLCLDPGNPKGFDSKENLCPVNSVPDATYDTEETSILSPDGNSARKFSEGTTNLAFALSRTFSSTISVQQGKQYNYSCFIKAGSPNRAFRLQWDGATTAFGNAIVVGFNPETLSFFTNFNTQSVGYESYSNGWYRFWFVTPVATTSSSTITPRIYMVNTTGGGNTLTNTYDNSSNLFVYYYGPQITTGPDIKPYVRTTGSAISLSTSILDLSGRGNNGTLVNGVGYNSANGGSLSFDGVNDYVLLTSTDLRFGGSNSYTFDFFIKVPHSTVNQTIFSNGNLATPGNGIWFFKRRSGLDNALTFHGYSTNPRIDLLSTNIIPDNNFCSVSLTFNGTDSYSLYINGQLENSITTNSIVAATGNSFIGATGGTGSFFSGTIYSAKIYNKALTAQEIQQNYNATKSRFL
jgi:hypothetical protein